MTITLRQYQQDAVNATYHYLKTRDDNPCIVIPTGGGKTPVMATICNDAVRWGSRVLVLAHVKELLEQTAGSLSHMYPDLFYGIYSAGLGSRDTQHDIIIGGIQSVYRRAFELGKIDLVLVDEAHMIPPDGEGMYRTLLKDLKIANPNIRIVGLTATPYRLGTGWICGPDNLLNEISFEISVKDLIAMGYLSPLMSRAGEAAARADVSTLHIRGGEYVESEVQDQMNDEKRVMAAVIDIAKQAADRKSVLIFASGVEHGKNITETLQEWVVDAGQSVEQLYGDSASAQRDAAIKKFKSGACKYLVNVGVLTTGFDAPNVDCVVLLRPTMSPGLYYQMVGRGFRLCDGKSNCLILDYGDNVLRHGPVDKVRPKNAAKRTGEKEPTDPEAQMIQCVNEMCRTIFEGSKCPCCGWEVPKPVRELKHDTKAGKESILSEVKTNTYKITGTQYYRHEKRQQDPNNPKPPTLRVDYKIGFNQYKSEWVCIQHEGFARKKAETWWAIRSQMPCPATVDEAVQLAQSGALCETTEITVQECQGEFDRLIDYKLGDIPDPPEFDWGSGTFGGAVDAPMAEDEVPF